MFGTSGIRGPVGETVTASLGVDLGRALARWGADRIVLGRDARAHGAYLASAVTSGARECGTDVVDVGVAATPTIARAVGWREGDAGVAITASHNPPADNGFKLWLPSGRAFPEREREVIEHHLGMDVTDADVRWDAVGRRTEWNDACDRHVAALERSAEVPRPLRVVVDAGNGTGGITARALSALGCEVTTIHGRQDGSFPGRPSEPTAENCTALRHTVPAIDADLGIAHDGDADRMRAVDANGEFLAGDTLLALFALAEVDPGDRVVAPVDVSLAVEDALTARDVELIRTPVGDAYVAEEIHAHDAVFGGEPSGAWIWPDAGYCPDGPLAACRLVERVARDGALSRLVADLDRYPIRRTSIDTARRENAMAGVERVARERYDDISTLDGIRVTTGAGWFLVRPSGTEPVMRLTAEARDAARAEELLDEARLLVSDNVNETDQIL